MNVAISVDTDAPVDLRSPARSTDTTDIPTRIAATCKLDAISRSDGDPISRSISHTGKRKFQEDNYQDVSVNTAMKYGRAKNRRRLFVIDINLITLFEFLTID